MSDRRFPSFKQLSSIRARIGLAVGGLALTLSLVLSVALSQRLADQIIAEKGSTMARLAERMAHELDDDLASRLEEIRTLAALDTLRDPSTRLEEKRRLLETLQAIQKDYAWIGLTDTRGRIVAGTGHLLEGIDVTERAYFVHGSQRPFVGDVHDAFLLAKFLPGSKDGLPLRLVDVAAPVKDSQGRPLGVLVGHLDWKWAERAKGHVLRPLPGNLRVDIVVLSRDSKVLIAPAGLHLKASQSFETPSAKAVAAGGRGSLLEAWPDGILSLTGYASGKREGESLALGWRALVRQDAKQALAEAEAMKRQILVAGAFSALAFGLLAWWLLGRIVQPITDIAQAAVRLREGQLGASIPLFRGEDETADLSRSIHDLFQALSRKEEELKELNASLESRVRERTAELSQQTQAANQVNGALIMTDLNGIIRTWNRGAERLYGYTADEAIGQHVSIFHPPEELEFLQNGIIASLKEHGSYEGDVISVTKSGKRFYCHLSLSMLRDEAGEAIGMIGYASDVTERMQAADNLARAKEAAEAASRAKSAFLATMSHEIRTPMNGIMGMTELVLDTPLTSEQRDYLKLVKISADGLLTVINDILDFSKIEAGKLSLEAIPFELRSTLDAPLRSLSHKAQEKGLRFSVEIVPDVPDLLVGDPGRLNQIIINLVGNAIKFTDEGGIRVQVAAEKRTADMAYLHFHVADTGIGISPEQQQTIFDTFAQADSSISRKYGGTGLGLAICKRLVGLMGGELWVESEAGKGSIFHFTAAMPLVAEVEKTQADRPATATAAPTSKTLEILLAEDNAINQKLAVTLLKKWGHRVTVAANGKEALARLAERSFDLILMDMQMPEMDGIEATRRIREAEEATGQRITIIAMTANAMASDRERCLAAGMDGYLSKPFDAASLAAAISGIVGAGTADTPATGGGFDYAAGLASADPQVLDVITGMFLAQCPGYLDEIAAAIEARDAERLTRAAHSLKGLLGYFAAEPAEKAARGLEQLGEQGNLAGAPDALAKLETEIGRLEPHLAAYLAASGARGKQPS